MKYGSVAAGHKSTAKAAMDILKDGGNAFDAVVTAVFVSMTSEYCLTGACGGGIMLAHPNNSSPIIFDFFIHTPKNYKSRKLDFSPVEINFGTSRQTFHIGKASIGVPGNVAGLLHIHSRLGSIPLKRIIAPAIHIAKHGTKINKAQEYLFNILDPILTYSNDGEKLFKAKERIMKNGDTFKNQDFANFLEELAIEGSNYIYKDGVSSSIIKLMKDGGLITRGDLLDYQVIERKPLVTKFYDKKIITNPPPSQDGSLISFILNLLSNQFKKNEINQRQLIIAMRLGQIIRKDLNAKKIDINNLFNKQFYDKYFDMYLKKVEKNIYNDKSGSGSTTHVSVIDSNNNSASITTSNGAGSGYIIPNTGIMMNNMLGEEDLNPEGFHSWNTSIRMQTMMSPTIISGNSGPELILGSGGSNRIGSAIKQVIINKYINGMDLTNSIYSSRIHLDGNIIHCEKGVDCKDLDFTWSKINQWDDKNLFFGGVNAVTKNEAVGDIRRGGCGLIS